MKLSKTIGIISPSAPIAGFCPQRLKRGIKELENIGFKIKLGNHISKITQHTAGTIKNRVDDIHMMFQDNEVNIIMCTIGGFNTNDLISYLDYSLIKKNNTKLFIGYSDITVLLHVLYEKSQVQTILGPMILPQFGEFGGVFDFTKKHFQNIINKINTGQALSIPISKEWTEEMTLWDKEDYRLRIMKKNKGIKIIQEGNKDGKLMGGNLRTLLTLSGTSYFPNLKNSILFLEDDNEENIATLNRMIRQLDQIGILSKINGLVFGRFQEKSNVTIDNLKEVISLTNIKKDIPIIFGLDFGHTDPMLTLPIGKKVIINTLKNDIQIFI